MATGYELQSGVQTGSFNLKGNELRFEIRLNQDNGLYFIDIYQEDTPVILGKYLTNGTDILFGKEYLGYGKSLTYRGLNDLSEGYLIYEE